MWNAFYSMFAWNFLVIELSRSFWVLSYVVSVSNNKRSFTNTYKKFEILCEKKFFYQGTPC